MSQERAESLILRFQELPDAQIQRKESLALKELLKDLLKDQETTSGQETYILGGSAPLA